MNFSNLSIGVSRVTEGTDPLIGFLKNWESVVGNYVKGYLLPIGVLLTLLNNFIVLAIIVKGRNVRNRISGQMRIYYASLAIGDTSTAIPLHATYFAGIINFYFFNY